MPRTDLAVAALLVLAGCSERKQDAAPVPPPPTKRTEPIRQKCDPTGGNVCAGDSVVECTGAGVVGRTVQQCKDGCRQAACVDTCAVHDVELIYVIDVDNNLKSFDPKRLPDDPFHTVGKLDCETGRPFSMAVDRRGVAWVVYDSGKLYRVSIIDGHCGPSGYEREDAASLVFGMGFASDGPKSDRETLFVASGDESHGFGRIDTSADPPKLVALPDLPAKPDQNPELSGTGDGKLFGYFPDNGLGFVQEIDRATSRLVGKRWPLRGKSAHVAAYAFAHWGGVFYVFTSTTEGESQVHSINRTTGAYKLELATVPSRIVGAGVSTCAPLLERVP
ncbi:MAG: hypothetical protein ABI175_25380 [Polyangiales bacterium]